MAIYISVAQTKPEALEQCLVSVRSLLITDQLSKGGEPSQPPRFLFNTREQLQLVTPSEIPDGVRWPVLRAGSTRAQ